LINGLGGACRVDELTNLQLENVKKEGQLFHIFIPNTKTKVSREFFVTVGGIEGVNMVEVIQKFLALRPNHAVHGRFFVGYTGGNCIKLPVGINTFSAMPKKIANFLNLPQAQEYTGHCFRRSSTSLLANTGADPLTIKRHGGWRSNAVCEGYIDTSVENKKKIATKILGGEMTDNENHAMYFDSFVNLQPPLELTEYCFKLIIIRIFKIICYATRCRYAVCF
jgi:integrase